MATINRRWVERWVRPHFDALGPGADIRNPRCLEVIGPNIRVGRSFSALATRDGIIRLLVDPGSEGRIDIGDWVALSPGVRISATRSITIGDGCLIARGVYITDSDWHDLYHRVFPPGPSAPVVLEENVWLCDGVIVCKGVHIGRNSVAGAGAVVTRDVPPNTVVAGNPAVVVKTLDPDQPMTTRRDLFTKLGSTEEREAALDRDALAGNTLLGWLRSMWRPSPDC